MTSPQIIDLTISPRSRRKRPRLISPSPTSSPFSHNPSPSPPKRNFVQSKLFRKRSPSPNFHNKRAASPLTTTTTATSDDSRTTWKHSPVMKGYLDRKDRQNSSPASGGTTTFSTARSLPSSSPPPFRPQEKKKTQARNASPMRRRHSDTPGKRRKPSFLYQSGIDRFTLPKIQIEQKEKYCATPWQELALSSDPVNMYPCYWSGPIGPYTWRRFEKSIHLPYQLFDREDVQLHYNRYLFSNRMKIQFMTPICFPLKQNRDEKDSVPQNTLLIGQHAHSKLGYRDAKESIRGMDVSIHDAGSTTNSLLLFSSSMLYFHKLDTSMDEDELDTSLALTDGSRTNKNSALSRIHTPFTSVSTQHPISEARWHLSQPSVIVSYYNKPSLEIVHPGRNYARSLLAPLNQDVLDFEQINNNEILCGCRNGGIQQVDLRAPPTISRKISSTSSRSNNTSSTGRRRKRRRCGTAVSSQKPVITPRQSSLSYGSPQKKDSHSINKVKFWNNIAYGASDRGHIYQYDRRKSLTVPLFDINLCTSVRDFDLQFKSRRNSLLPKTGSSRPISSVTQNQLGTSCSVLGLALSPFEPNYVAFQLQSGHVGFYNVVQKKLTKLYHNFDIRHARGDSDGARKLPLTFIPFEYQQQANFLYSSCQKHLILLDFSEAQYDSIDSKSIQKAQAQHLSLTRKENNSDGQNLLLNKWNVKSRITGMKYVNNRLWCVNERGNIFEVSTESKGKGLRPAPAPTSTTNQQFPTTLDRGQFQELQPDELELEDMMYY